MFRAYFPVVEQKAKLRIYLNDPELTKQVKAEGRDKLNFPIPLELRGRFVLAVSEKGLHIFFDHKLKDEGFIPIFIDLAKPYLDFREFNKQVKALIEQAKVEIS